MDELDRRAARAELAGHPIVRPGAHQARRAGRRPGKDGAFDGERADELAARGAERAPDGELPRPGDGARQQEVRQVGAGDQQDERGKSDQHEDDLAAGALERGVERDCAQDPTLVFLRIAAGEACRDRRQPGVGLGGSHPRTIAPDDVVRVVLPLTQLVGRQRKRLENLRGEQSPGIAGERRGDADDLIRLSVDPKRAADDTRLAGEVRPPVLVAQNDDLVAAGLVLVGLEIPPEFHPQTQDAEIAGGGAE